MLNSVSFLWFAFSYPLTFVVSILSYAELRILVLFAINIKL